MQNTRNMKLGKGRRLGWLAVAVLASLPLLLSRPAAAQTTYTITDLGTLGGTFSAAGYVNANGAAGGSSLAPRPAEEKNWVSEAEVP
jgi:hypothetical protein